MKMSLEFSRVAIRIQGPLSKIKRTSLFWSHNFGCNPDPLRRLEVTTTKIRVTTKTFLRTIQILKSLHRSHFPPHSVMLDPDGVDDMLKRVQESFNYCILGSSSGKQTKVRCLSQPQTRSKITLIAIKTHQYLLAFQQEACNSNTDSFNKNICRISDSFQLLIKSMWTFNGKSNKFDLLEHLSPNMPRDTKPAAWRKQEKSSSLSYGRWCVVDLWNHRQPNTRFFGRKTSNTF